MESEMKQDKGPGQTWMIAGACVSAGILASYMWWKRTQQPVEQPVEMPAGHACRLLSRAAPMLRLPESNGGKPELLSDGAGLRCPATGRVYPYRNGILDLLSNQQTKTFTQRALDTSFTAWAYDRFRQAITRILDSPDFPVEVAMAQSALQLQPGDVVLDLACGQGNFTVEWAKRVGPAGLVIGLDYSWPMLQRAAYHVQRWGLDNVLLIHGDAHHLPFADGALSKVNCSGGFHQFPDLPQAVHEIARASANDAVLTASTFAQRPDDPRAALKRWLERRFDLYFVPLAELGEQLRACGYGAYAWALPGGGWFGYASARKT
jgi:ubiquinone/menaquinone biosynthesis C-methylase UbiE